MGSGRHQIRARKVVAGILALAWILGPAMPSISCALTVSDPATAVATPVPNCHGVGATDALPEHADPTERPGASGKACCGDVNTNCCISAFDIDGALAAVDILSPPALTVLPVSVVIPLPSDHATFDAPASVDPYPPPAPLFRVLRL